MILNKEKTLGTNEQNIYAYSFVSEHSKHFLFFLLRKKNLKFKRRGVRRVRPPPLSGRVR